MAFTDFGLATGNHQLRRQRSRKLQRTMHIVVLVVVMVCLYPNIKISARYFMANYHNGQRGLATSTTAADAADTEAAAAVAAADAVAAQAHISVGSKEEFYGSSNKMLRATNDKLNEENDIPLAITNAINDVANTVDVSPNVPIQEANGEVPSQIITTPTNNNSTTTTGSSNACFSSQCFQAIAEPLARAFPDRTRMKDWCLSRSKAKHASPNDQQEGLILVKVPKAASSTAAGIAHRIAQRHRCQALHWQHKPGRTYHNRNAAKSFMFTSIRDPATRVLSYLFFMEISIGGTPYSDEWMLDRLKHFSGRYGSIQDGQGGFTMQFASLDETEIPQYQYWSPEARTSVQNATQVHEQVQRMIQGYDFMLVVDRMDESLVAMSLLLGIDVGDVLVTSSKEAGTNYFYDPPRRQCVSLTKPYTSPAVQAYLESDDWKAQNYGDYLLHAAANHSLDRTIERLGRTRFDAAMKRYQHLKQQEQEECAPQAQFPCSNEGTPQPRLARSECYQRDFGCGYKCIDKMVARHPPPADTFFEMTTNVIHMSP